MIPILELMNFLVYMFFKSIEKSSVKIKEIDLNMTVVNINESSGESCRTSKLLIHLSNRDTTQKCSNKIYSKRIEYLRVAKLM